MKFMTVAAKFFPAVITTTAPTMPTPADWATIITSVTSNFSVANIVLVLASVVTAGIVFVFLWWGIRLAFRSIMGAVKNGSLSINGGRKKKRGG
ncbi:MAG: hypothetical protein J1D87_11715 [Lachnospiraceae bacterium]|nr:hypothetical protein [Lachnospiraceae bacterium]